MGHEKKLIAYQPRAPKRAFLDVNEKRPAQILPKRKAKENLYLCYIINALSMQIRTA